MSIHRGTVTDNVDPARLGRLRVVVPDLSESPLPWALPVIPLGAHDAEPFPLGAHVWVTFENDDPDHPIVLGRLPSR